VTDAARLAALLAEARRRSTRADHRPHPKQVEFLQLAELEALYGGAAGGGKSDALLMDAAQNVHQRGYAALLLRRTYPDLKLPGAIMDRSHMFFADRARWNEVDRRWTFPGGAVIQFGYCDTEGDLARYKSSEFQFIGIDELTEWPERWYTFLFSRLRRTIGVDVPLKMRAATNPDGLGQEWVRRRFGIPLNETPTAIIRTRDGDDERVFLPARAEDNPSLDLTAYEKSLRKMGPARYAQLRHGRWLRDGEGLVYKFDAIRNRAPGVRAVLAPAKDAWSFILAHDYGTTKATAWAVLGWAPHDPILYVVESFKREGTTPSEAAEVSLRLVEKYAPDRIVGDLGGLGKGYAVEARRRFRLPIIAAKKTDKRGYIDLFNGDLQGGLVKLLDGNGDLETEWNELPWAKHRIEGEQQKEAEGFPNHIADAVLYGWREAYAYLEEPRKPKPTAAEREEEMEREVVAQHERELAAEWWDKAPKDEGDWWAR